VSVTERRLRWAKRLPRQDVEVVAAAIFDFKDTLAFIATDGPSINEVASARGFVIGEPGETPSLTSDATSQAAFEQEVRSGRRQVLRTAGATDAEIDQIFEEVESGRRALRMELFPEVPVVLEVLHSAGLPLGICSNWDWHLDKHLASLGIADAFAVVTCSARCGFWKPHPKIFELTAAAIAVDPSEVVFVGDNYRNDIEPAELAGMRGFHVHRRPCDAPCRRSGDDLTSLVDYLSDPLPRGSRRMLL
jgi:HAD superfamily hydrolase (TIGR01549 family)